jgi:hypothetical protein
MSAFREPFVRILAGTHSPDRLVIFHRDEIGAFLSDTLFTTNSSAQRISACACVGTTQALRADALRPMDVGLVNER